MSNTKQVIIRSGLGFVALCFLFLSGCVESEMLPPASYAVKVPGAIGSFYMTDEKGIRQDCRITYQANKAMPYMLDGGIKDDGTPDISSFQLYKIGNEYWGFLRDDSQPEGRKKTYHLFRLYLTRTQLVVYVGKAEFFAKNPNALPGIKFTGWPKPKTNVVLQSSPKQLVAFLNLHANTKELLDMEQPVILNRIGT